MTADALAIEAAPAGDPRGWAPEQWRIHRQYSGDSFNNTEIELGAELPYAVFLQFNIGVGIAPRHVLNVIISVTSACIASFGYDTNHGAIRASESHRSPKTYFRQRSEFPCRQSIKRSFSARAIQPALHPIRSTLRA